MAVRLGLGFSRGTPLKIGLVVIAIAALLWFAGFVVLGAMVAAVGATILLERRRSIPELRRNS